MEYIHQLTHDQTPAEVKNKMPVYNTHRREPLAHGGKYQPGSKHGHMGESKVPKPPGAHF